MCYVFIQDWFSQPLSPAHTLYREIHPKRLLRVLPEVAPIFIRFIKGLTFYDITGIFFTIEKTLINAAANLMFEPKDFVDDFLLRLSWTTMADHYIGKNANEIRLIEDILTESYVCKGNQKELIGYYLTDMIVNMKEVHACHVSIRSPPINEALAATDTFITIGPTHDDLYD